MITLSALVICFALWLGFRNGYLSVGSVVVGVLVGLVFAGTALGGSIGTGVTGTANSIGTSAQAGLSSLIKK